MSTSVASRVEKPHVAPSERPQQTSSQKDATKKCVALPPAASLRKSPTTPSYCLQSPPRLRIMTRKWVNFSSGSLSLDHLLGCISHPSQEPVMAARSGKPRWYDRLKSTLRKRPGLKPRRSQIETLEDRLGRESFRACSALLCGNDRKTRRTTLPANRRECGAVGLLEWPQPIRVHSRHSRDRGQRA